MKLMDPSLDDGSFDLCSSVTLSVDSDQIPCAHDAYVQHVTLNVTDEDGNTSTCVARATLLGDADHDGVGDACDICPGIDDRIDLRIGPAAATHAAPTPRIRNRRRWHRPLPQLQRHTVW